MAAAEGRFLVIGICGLVLRDIVGIMRDAYPQLVPLVAQTLADAANQVERGTAMPFAFLNLGPANFIADEMSRVLDRIGTRVILMGDDAEDSEDAKQQSSFPILMRPFFQEDVLELLDNP